MSFFDDVSDMVNRGAAAAQRAGKITQIRFQIGDLDRQKRELFAKLGESIFENVASVSLVRAGHEELFDSIDDIVAKMGVLEEEIAALEAEAEAEENAPEVEICPQCGGAIGENDKFCCTCGAPVEREVPAPEPTFKPNAFCTNCGTPVKPTDLFCMNCGTKLERNVDEVVPNALENMPEPPVKYDADLK